MKENYLLSLLIMLFSMTSAVSQNCPDSIGTQSTVTRVHFKIVSGTCNDYPTDITIDGSAFTKGNCNGTNMYYDLVPPDPALSSPDTFSADFGFGICTYVNGALQTLSSDDFEAESGFGLFPNPVRKDGILNLKFSVVVDAEVSMFDVTGKQLLSFQVKGSNYSTINMRDFDDGIYLVKIHSENMNLIRKVILKR